MSGRIKKLIEHAIDILVNIRGLESNPLFLAVVVLKKIEEDFCFVLEYNEKVDR